MARSPAFALLSLLTMGCGSSDDSTFFEDVASSETASTTTAGLSPVGTTSSTDNGSTSSAATGAGGSAVTAVSGSANAGGTGGGSTSVTSSNGAGGSAGTGGGVGAGGSGAVGGSTATVDSGSGGAGGGGVGGSGGSTSTSAGTGGVSGGPGSTSGTIPVDGTVSVQETCEFEPCGGELDDESFEYVGACMEKQALLDSFARSCNGVEVIDASGTIEGTISFANGRFEQDVALELSVQYHVPRQCSFGASCTLVAASLISGGAMGTRCVNADNGGCNCTRPLSLPANASGRYTTDDDELSLGGTSVNYCASGGSLQYANGVGDWDYVLQATSQ